MGVAVIASGEPLFLIPVTIGYRRLLGFIGRSRGPDPA
jgi:hypothetical protein